MNRANAFEVVWANDIDKTACLTYENYFKHEIVCGDISEILSGKHIKSNTFPSKADIVLGGFPCQDFSHAGKRKGFDSERGNLYQSMISVVKKTSPKDLASKKQSLTSRPRKDTKLYPPNGKSDFERRKASNIYY